jgi:hypothetical protein
MNKREMEQRTGTIWGGQFTAHCPLITKKLHMKPLAVSRYRLINDIHSDFPKGNIL